MPSRRRDAERGRSRHTLVAVRETSALIYAPGSSPPEGKRIRRRGCSKRSWAQAPTPSPTKQLGGALPGIPHLGLEHRAAWAETKPDGTVTPRWSVGSSWIRSAIPTLQIMEMLLAALGRPNFTGQDRQTYCAHCDFGYTELRGHGRSR